MKSIIFYSSEKYGNTKKIAEVIAQSLGADLFCLNNHQHPHVSLDDYDLIGLGSGIRTLQYEKDLRSFAGKEDFRGRTLFLFMTCGSGWEKLHDNPTTKRLIKNGARIIGRFTCKGFAGAFPLSLFGGINKGHPNPQDLENARRFAEGIKSTAQALK